MDWHEYDRAHGFGLPAQISTRRLARRLAEAKLPRVASRTAAMANGYEPVQGVPGLFRKAHTLWNIRAAEDGQGYVLIRLRDEPAPGIEPRSATVQVQVTVDDAEDESLMPREDAVLIPLGEVHVAQRADQNYAENADWAERQEFDIGEVLEVQTPFAPILYGKEVVLPPNQLFTVAGYSKPTPEDDARLGFDFQSPLYPEEGQDSGYFTRVRVRDDQSGVEIALLPAEVSQFLSARGSYPKPFVPHRSRPRVPGQPAPEEGVGPDTAVPNIDEADTVLDSTPEQRAPTVNNRR